MDLSNITVNKQSSIRIAGEKIIYFDPIEIGTATNDADYIFVSHEHFDHFEPASIEKIKNENTTLVAPASMKKKVIAEALIPESNCVFLEPGDVVSLNGVSVEAVPAYNNLKPFHPKFSKWLGYVVTVGDVRYYMAGDTDVNKDNKNVKCDVALLPVGGKFTMNVKAAAELAQSILPKAVIPIHYGEIVGKPTDGNDFKQLLESSGCDIQVELKI